MKKIFLLTVGLMVLTAGLEAQELNNFSFGRGQRVQSPVIGTDSVTFNFSAANATAVTLSGNWAEGRGGAVQMTKNGNVWTAKIPMPEPEIYTYSFIVDGISLNDPQNVMVQRDGSRYLSMLLIDGERSANYKEAPQRGTVSHVWYDSGILGINRRMTVYLPYGYEDNPDKRYPVLYLLHGAGGDEEAWISMGRAAQIMDNLICKGEAVPMIVVIPNGNPGQQAAQTLGLPVKTFERNDPASANGYVRSLVTEIVPYIDKHYRTDAKPASRAIAGLSMGGGHTTTAAIMYPGTFDYICPMSSGLRAYDDIDKDLQGIKKAGYKLFFVGCGTADNLAYASSQNLDAALTRNGMEHINCFTPGGHTWSNWRFYLNTIGKLLFK